MNRSTFKTLGLALLLPGLLLAVLPMAGAYTNLLNHVGSFDLSIGGHTLAAVRHAGGIGSAEVSPLVWVAAATGELMLLWVHLTRPQLASRFGIAGR